MNKGVTLADIEAAVKADQGITEDDVKIAEKDIGALDIPASEEDTKSKKYRGKNKSKVDQIEAKAQEHILEMFEAIEGLKQNKGKTLADMAKKDPFMATQMVKELNLMVKRILDITITKLRIEELRAAKSKEGDGNNNGTKNYFIIQGLYDGPGAKAIEANTEQTGPVKFAVRGLTP